METIRLQQFCYIVETGSLSKASTLSGISLSGLSKSMRLLQEEINCVLLVHQGRGIQVTKSGEQFYQKALSVLDAVKNLKLTNNLDRKLVRIGINEIFSYNLVNHFFNIDNFAIEWHQLNSGEIEKSILSNTIDYGITYKPIPQLGINHTKLTTFSIGIFARQSYIQKLEKKENATIEFVYPLNGLPLDPSDMVNKKFWYQEFEKQVAKRKVSHLNLGISCAQENDLAIFLPHFAVKKINEKMLSHYHFKEITSLKKKCIFTRDAHLVFPSTLQNSKQLTSLVNNLKIEFS